MTFMVGVIVGVYLAAWVDEQDRRNPPGRPRHGR